MPTYPGCQATDADPGCNPRFHTEQSDALNLRCWDQKRRYGVDFLYSVQRYIDGLTKMQVPNRRGDLVQNPLFSDLSCTAGNCPSQRDPSLVFVAGIVGVPWQDTATEETVKAHLKNIMGKLEAADRTEAVMIGLRRGMIHLDD